MGVAEATGLDPVSALVQDLVTTLYERAQGLVWRSTPQGLVADVAEGELLLSPLPGPTAVWKLSVVFLAEPQSGDAGPSERGRRVIGWGPLGHMQQRALDLAMYGVPGGPTLDQSSMAWVRARGDGSLRMTVPGGELRVMPVDGELCALTHEDEHGVELLSIGTTAELERQALPMCLTRATRPLQVRLHGRRVNLRSIGVAGVLGYHELKDRSFIVLALIRGDILLLHVRGIFHRVVARLSWTDLMFGEPVEAALAMHAAAVPGPESLHLGVDREAITNNPFASRYAAGEAPKRDTSAANSRPPGVDVPSRAAHTPMAERHRDLCRRYFRRLHDRLSGRGARKARRLVLLLLEALDQLHEDITGSRLEIHTRLERVLARRMPGGPRNIRDCLDLLMRTSPIARAEPGKRCTLRFAELHDPESELMRFIASDDEGEEPAANAKHKAAAPPMPRSGDGASSLNVATDPPVADASEPAPGTAQPVAREVIDDQPSTLAAREPAPDPDPAPSLVEVFRRLGRQSKQPPAATGSTPESNREQTAAGPAAPNETTTSRAIAPCPAKTPTSRHAFRGFVRRGSFFLGEFVDDDDETDAPSRFRGQREPDRPGAPPGPVKPKASGKS